MTKLILTYWALRGRGQPVRHLAEYLEVDYTDDIIKPSEGAAYFEMKGKMAAEGNYFCNMPHITDTDSEGNKVFISETSACSHYLAQKAKRPQMIATTAQQVMAYSQIMDIFGSITRPSYSSVDIEAFKETLVKVLESNSQFSLKGLALQLEGKSWLFGEEIMI